MGNTNNTSQNHSSSPFQQQHSHSQSSHQRQLLPSSQKRPYLQIDPTQNATLVDQKEFYKIYKNSRAQLYEKYIVKKNNQEPQHSSFNLKSKSKDSGFSLFKSTFEQDYHYRLTHRSKQFVQLFYAKQISPAFNCTLNQEQQYEVVTQRIKYRLNDMYNLSFYNAIIILKVCLKGFKNLYTYNGVFWPKDTMIGINFYDEVKVWLNPNFSLNYKEAVPLSLVKLSAEQQEDMIVNNLIDMISSKTFPSHEWRQFIKLKSQTIKRLGNIGTKNNTERHNYQKNNKINQQDTRMTFDLALQLVFQIANRYKIQNFAQINRIHDIFNQMQKILIEGQHAFQNQPKSNQQLTTNYMPITNNTIQTFENRNHSNNFNLERRNHPNGHNFTNPFLPNSNTKNQPQFTHTQFQQIPLNPNNLSNNQYQIHRQISHQNGKISFQHRRMSQDNHSKHGQITAHNTQVHVHNTLPVLKNQSKHNYNQIHNSKYQQPHNSNIQTNQQIIMTKNQQGKSVYPNSLSKIKSHIMGPQLLNRTKQRQRFTREDNNSNEAHQGSGHINESLNNTVKKQQHIDRIKRNNVSSPIAKFLHQQFNHQQKLCNQNNQENYHLHDQKFTHNKNISQQYRQKQNKSQNFQQTTDNKQINYTSGHNDSRSIYNRISDPIVVHSNINKNHPPYVNRNPPPSFNKNHTHIQRQNYQINPHNFNDNYNQKIYFNAYQHRNVPSESFVDGASLNHRKHQKAVSQPMNYNTSHVNFTPPKLKIKFNNKDYSLKQLQMKNPQLYINQNINKSPREQTFKIHDNNNVARQHRQNNLIQQKQSDMKEISLNKKYSLSAKKSGQQININSHHNLPANQQQIKQSHSSFNTNRREKIPTLQITNNRNQVNNSIWKQLQQGLDPNFQKPNQSSFINSQQPFSMTNNALHNQFSVQNIPNNCSIGPYLYQGFQNSRNQQYDYNGSINNSLSMQNQRFTDANGFNIINPTIPIENQMHLIQNPAHPVGPAYFIPAQNQNPIYFGIINQISGQQNQISNHQQQISYPKAIIDMFDSQISDQKGRQKGYSNGSRQLIQTSSKQSFQDKNKSNSQIVNKNDLIIKLPNCQSQQNLHNSTNQIYKQKQNHYQINSKGSHDQAPSIRKNIKSSQILNRNSRSSNQCLNSNIIKSAKQQEHSSYSSLNKNKGSQSNVNHSHIQNAEGQFYHYQIKQSQIMLSNNNKNSIFEKHSIKQAQIFNKKQPTNNQKKNGQSCQRQQEQFRDSQCNSESQTIINKLSKWQKRDSVQQGMKNSNQGLKLKQSDFKKPKTFLNQINQDQFFNYQAGSNPFKQFNKIIKKQQKPHENNSQKVKSPISGITYKDLRQLLAKSQTTNQDSD